MTAQKKQRKILVQLMSPHQHMEQVEVSALVREDSPGEFVGELEATTEQAIARLASLHPDGAGPWRDRAESFEAFNHLVAYVDPVGGGPRVAAVRQVEYVAAREWA